MSEKVLCEKSDLVAIADAVREATGSAENYNVSELSTATIEAISAGGGEDISVETAEYTELLTNLESAIDALPEAGGGEGSGTVDTCTVSINYSVSRSALYMWDVVGYDAESGEIIQHYNSTFYPADGILTFDNVVCGSVFSLYCEGMGLPSSCDVTGGAEVLILGMIQGASCTRIHVKAPTTAGSVCTCTVT